jgi:hypothetical protein
MDHTKQMIMLGVTVSILTYNGGYSTEIIAGLPVMFYGEHEFINIRSADNFKRRFRY